MRKANTGCRVTWQADLVTNGGATGSGTAIAQIAGLSSLLQLGVYVAWVSTNKTRPAAFGGSTFSIYGYVEDENGEIVKCSDTPINNDGFGDAAAPDGWEGATTLRGLEVQLAYAGIATVGFWRVILVAEPGAPMDGKTFEALTEAIGIRVTTKGTTTP